MLGIESLDLEAVYRRLPIPLQHAGCSLVGWRTERTRYGRAFQRMLEEAITRTYWSPERLAAFRDRRLMAQVEHAVHTSSFWGERFRAAGLAPVEIRSIEDLALVPIVTKAEVQEHAAACTSLTPRRGTRVAQTSGSTGSPLRFRVTMTAIHEQWAIWWRYRSWHGIQKDTWCALFAGRSIVPITQTDPPFWRVNYPGRQLLFSGWHISPQNLSAYVHELPRRRPPWLHGYPSILALLATYLLESGADLGYDVRWATTGSENLMPQQAAVIERALGVRPIQHYGLTEGVANISQCERGSLHVDEDFSAVEFLPTGEDNLHRIVGTNFTNPAMPLLRYDTQDLAAIRSGASCECGRSGRVVERLDGRLQDYVILRNGARITAMENIFEDMVNIREAQIHQTRPGEITIRVVRGEAYGPHDEQALLRETVKLVGSEAEVSIEYRDALPRSPTGKLRFVESDIPEALIAEIGAARV